MHLQLMQSFGNVLHPNLNDWPLTVTKPQKGLHIGDRYQTSDHNSFLAPLAATSQRPEKVVFLHADVVSQLGFSRMVDLHQSKILVQARIFSSSPSNYWSAFLGKPPRSS